MSVDHTPAKEIIEAAYKAVKESGIPAGLQEVAFTKAVDLLASKIKPSSAVIETNDTSAGGGDGTVDERMAKIAKRMGVEVNTLRYVYELDDEGVTLIVKRAKLASDKANATGEIAVLYCAARQAGGYDEGYTTASEVRDRVKDYGVLDANNFAGKIGKMTDWFAMKGSGAKRELKATQTGYEEAAKIVGRITGGQP